MFPHPELADIYEITLTEAWHDQTKHAVDDKRQISNRITELENRLSYLRELLSTQKIEPDDYRVMKPTTLKKSKSSSQNCLDFPKTKRI